MIWFCARESTIHQLCEKSYIQRLVNTVLFRVVRIDKYSLTQEDQFYLKKGNGTIILNNDHLKTFQYFSIFFFRSRILTNYPGYLLLTSSNIVIKTRVTFYTILCCPTHEKNQSSAQNKTIQRHIHLSIRVPPMTCLPTYDIVERDLRNLLLKS